MESLDIDALVGHEVGLSGSRDWTLVANGAPQSGVEKDSPQDYSAVPRSCTNVWGSIVSGRSVVGNRNRTGAAEGMAPPV